MINTLTLQGRLTADPDLRTTPTGTAVCSLTLANDTGSGEHKKTLFLNCIAWKGAGETIAKYFKKGSMIIVTGTLEPKDWKDKEGKNHKNYELNIRDFGFCESGKDKGATYQTPTASPSFSSPADFEEVNEDDLPF